MGYVNAKAMDLREAVSVWAKERLGRERDALTTDLARLRDSPRPSADVGDDEERATHHLAQDIRLASAQIAADALRSIDDALCHLERGDYGICLDCEEPIPGRRLMALPFAERCCPCQAAHEDGTRGGRTFRQEGKLRAADGAATRSARAIARSLERRREARLARQLLLRAGSQT